MELITKERRLRWFGHILRMDDGRVGQTAEASRALGDGYNKSKAG